MIDKIRVRNTRTGAVGWMARHLFENPRFNSGILVEVDEDSKPYVPELFKSKKPSKTEKEPTRSEEKDVN